MTDFIALDFETADTGRDSACSLALVLVRNGKVADTWHRLIRPPRQTMMFTHIHGIDWDQVKESARFRPFLA